MGDTLITVIAIFLAAILMFVFPLMALSERTDDMAQLSVQTATTEFVDNVRTTGKLNLSDYEQFLQTITATGNAFDVELEIKHLDEDISNFLIKFSKATEDASNNIPYYKISGLENMNKVNITCIPWITFSNFKNAVNFNERNSKPKICWGRYYLEGDRYLIDISLLVNHAFQDGYHMGLFFNNLQQNIYNIKVDKNLVKVR